MTGQRQDTEAMRFRRQMHQEACGLDDARVSEFDSIRHKMLESQRQCGFCSKVFETADELVMHLVSVHPRKPTT